MGESAVLLQLLLKAASAMMASAMVVEDPLGWRWLFLTADSPNPSLPPLLLPLPPRLLTPPGTVHFILRGKELYIKEIIVKFSLREKNDFKGSRCFESILYFALFKFIVRMSIL